MHVARLEVFGFKSFMERLVLPLTQGITGVVGPNGCGKSNIVDALRWVMGETRASQLRGEVLEDVIFNGTETQRPLGLAEVTLVIRADSGNFIDDLRANGTIAPSASSYSPADNNGDLAANADRLDDSGKNDPLHHLSDIQGIPERLRWLQSTTEIQVTRRLYRSGESEFLLNKVPCRLKDIREVLRSIGLHARGYTIIAQGEVGRIVSSKPEERRLIIEEVAQISGFRESISAVTRRLDETAVSLSRLDDIIREVSRQVGSLKRQATRAEARAELKSRLLEIDRYLHLNSLSDLRIEERRLEGEFEAVQRQISETRQRVDENIEAEERHRKTLEVLDTDLDQKRESVDQLKGRIVSRDRDLAEGEAQVRELEGLLIAKRSELERVSERLEILESRLVESKAELVKLDQQEHEYNAEIASMDGASEEQLKQLTSDLVSSRKDLAQNDQESRGVNDKLVAMRSRREVLHAQVLAASPVSQFNRAQSDQWLSDGSKQMGILVEGLKVPSGYIRALQAVLSERASYLVSEDPLNTALMFGKMLQMDPKSSERLSIGVLRAGTNKAGTKATNESITSNGIKFTSLLSTLTVADWCEAATCSLLRDVYLAENLVQAISYFQNSSDNSNVTLVTPEGDLVTRDMFSSLRHTGGLVQAVSEVADLDREIATLEEKDRTIKTAHEHLAKQIAVLEEEYQAVLRASQANQVKVRELMSAVGAVRGRRQGHASQLALLEQDSKRNIEHLRELEEEVRIKQEHLSASIENVDDIKNSSDEIDESKLLELEADIKHLSERKYHNRELSIKLVRDADQSRKKLNELRDRNAQIGVNREKTHLQFENLRESVLKEYGESLWGELLSAESSSEEISNSERDEYVEEAQRIRERMQREGEVDPTAVEEYRAEEKRLDELTAQKNDLEAAADTLKESLEKLTTAAKDRFLETLEAIRVKFSEFGPRLFGGGTADLELTDLEDPLSGGVEIFLRPPGKRPKNMDVLSGGEKALTATALVFAMFMVKPSPLCVLDEVDAPLDESNVKRFLDFVKEMSNSVQFMMVTHNKQSMAASNTLVGVTMPEPGASRVLSVSLHDALAHVA